MLKSLFHEISHLSVKFSGVNVALSLGGLLASTEVEMDEEERVSHVIEEGLQMFHVVLVEYISNQREI